VSWLARRLVGLYPRAWRERYEEEFVAMLEQDSASLSGLLDVALGVLDAWLWPQVTSEGRSIVTARMRSSVLGVLWAWVGLVVAGVGFQKMAEYEDFVDAARENPLVGLSFDAIVGGAVVALAAVLAGGAPVALAALRGAIAEGRRDVVLLLCVPPLSLAGFVGYVLLVGRVIYPSLADLSVHAAINVAIFLSLVGAFVVAAVASAGAVTAAVGRAEVGGRPIRFALYAAVVAALAMAVVLMGTVVWGLALLVSAPSLFLGDEGLLATPTAATWLAVVALMATSAGAAAFAVVRGLRARREAAGSRAPSA
jgi:hypothetical protein